MEQEDEGTGVRTRFDSARPYRLHPQVALRPEPFGALAYHYGNRRLTFLKDERLVVLVRALESHGSADEALEALGLSMTERQAFERSLAGLEVSEIIHAR